jgi:DNA replication and repair protein RecF
MRVESLYICNFRNLEPQEIHLGPSLNEFVGDNAQGKTAFLEALHALILGVSFRTHLLRDVVSHGKSECLIEAEICAGGVHTALSFHYDMKERSVSINGAKQPSSAALLGNLLGVTCSLHDNELIYGSPAIRRRYLDQQIAQIDPFYVDQLRRYTRALMQRNRLLRTGGLRVIRAFEEQLAKAASYLISVRRSTVESLQNLVIPFYNELFGSASSQPFSIRYQTQCPSDDVFVWHMDQYEKRRDREAKMMMTLVGPHRDDVDLLLNDHPSKVVGSFGQIRAIGLALRLAEWNLLKTRSGQSPIFLIDDMTSSLDFHRTERLLKICESFGQIFISNCEPVSAYSNQFLITSGVAAVTRPSFQ